MSKKILLYFLEDEEDMKLSPPVYYKKPSGNPRGGRAKNMASEYFTLQTLHLGTIFGDTDRKKYGGKHGSLALEIMGRPKLTINFLFVIAEVCFL